MVGVKYKSDCIVLRLVGACMVQTLVLFSIGAVVCSVPVSGSDLAVQEAQERVRDEKTEEKPFDTGDLDIQDGGRNAGEPENANRRTKAGIFSFYAELYSRYKDKEFKETDEESHRTTVVTTAAAEIGAVLLEREKSRLKSEFRFRRNFDSRSGSPDWSDYDLTLDYKFRGNGLQTTFFSTQNRLAFFLDDEVVLKDETGVELAYSRRLGRRLRFRARQEFSREVFSEVKERDAAEYKTRIDFKYRFHPLFYPGIGFRIDSKSADLENIDRREVAPVFLLTSQFRNRAIMTLTYRYRFRDYTTANDADSNYQREDRGPKLSFGSYIRLKANVWLRLFGSLESFDSRRRKGDREFGKVELGMGLRYFFP